MNPTKIRSNSRLDTISEFSLGEERTPAPTPRRSARLQSRHSTPDSILGSCSTPANRARSSRASSETSQVAADRENRNRKPQRTKGPSAESDKFLVPSKILVFLPIALAVTLILSQLSSASQEVNRRYERERTGFSISAILNFAVDLWTSIKRYLVWPKITQRKSQPPGGSPSPVIKVDCDRLKELFGNLDVNNATALVETAVEKAWERLETRLKSFESEIKVLLKERHIAPHREIRQDKTAMNLIKSTIDLYHADQIGRVDYALSNHGGAIVSIHDTQPYLHSTRFFGLPWHSSANPPELMITPGIMPGQCWAFQGSKGEVDIALALPVRVREVTVEHTPKSIVIKNDIRSAPKQFSIWGKNVGPSSSLFATLDASKMDEEPQFLGRFTFSYEGGSIQHFSTKAVNRSFSHINFKIESNHGNKEFTCVYRLRVHGDPS